MAFGTGWFVARGRPASGRSTTAVDLLRVRSRAAPATCCRSASMRIGGRLFWLAQFSGWDHERYVVVEIKPKTVEAVVERRGEGRVEVSS